MNCCKKAAQAVALAIGLLAFVQLHAQSSSGWNNLISGNSLKGWKKVGGSGLFNIENGVIVGTSVADSVNTFLITEKEYGDFILELDVMIESAESNSGIQTRSHFNTPDHPRRVYGRQMEIDPSARKWAGGIYDEERRGWIYPLQLNPAAQSAFIVGKFNHVKIECIGNEMKTWINHIPAASLVDTLDSKGFIGLQVHAAGDVETPGKKVYFKNIRIKTSGLQKENFPAAIYTVNNIPNSLSVAEKQHGWSLLFDGQSSKGWVSAKADHFPEQGWKIQDGVLQVLSSEGKEAANGGDIVTEKMYRAFDLSFDFMLTPGANSGVKYFVTLQEKSNGSAIGLEYQLLDDVLHPDAKLGINGNRTLASLYDLIPSSKERRILHPVGSWNTGRIVVYPNNHVEHYLNGIKVLEYERTSEELAALISKSKYSIWPNFGQAEQGHILLQDHGNTVSFRSIKLREL